MTARDVPWRDEKSTISGPGQATACCLGFDPSGGIPDAVRTASEGGASPNPYPVRDPGPLPMDESDEDDDDGDEEDEDEN